MFISNIKELKKYKVYNICFLLGGIRVCFLVLVFFCEGTKFYLHLFPWIFPFLWGKYNLLKRKEYRNKAFVFIPFFMAVSIRMSLWRNTVNLHYYICVWSYCTYCVSSWISMKYLPLNHKQTPINSKWSCILKEDNQFFLLLINTRRCGENINETATQLQNIIESHLEGNIHVHAKS